MCSEALELLLLRKKNIHLHIYSRLHASQIIMRWAGPSAWRAAYLKKFDAVTAVPQSQNTPYISVTLTTNIIREVRSLGELWLCSVRILDLVHLNCTISRCLDVISCTQRIRLLRNMEEC